MSIPDPPWKLRTRPCPFYSQGRCLFSDSCNFLHDAKIKVKAPVFEMASVCDSLDFVASPPSIQVSRVATPPSCASSDDGLDSYRSPPRSPRLSSLLLALGDAIEPEEESEGLDWTTTEEPVTYDGSENLGQEEQLPGEADIVGGVDAEEDMTLLEEMQDEPLRLTSANNDVISDADSVHPASEQLHEVLSDELDADTTVVVPLAGTSGEPPVAEVQSRTEDGLLSPIEIKLAAPRSVPLESLESMCTREDSIDSGYAESWIGPTPHALSPPRNERRFSTLSILSSPFGTPSARVLSPTFVPSTSSGWPATTLFSSKTSTADESEEAIDHQAVTGAFMNDLDSPSDYHRRHSSSSHGSHTSGVDVEDTVKPPATTILHSDQFDEPHLVEHDNLETSFSADREVNQHTEQTFADEHVHDNAAQKTHPEGSHQSLSLFEADDIFNEVQARTVTPEVVLQRSSAFETGLEDTPYVEETPSRRGSVYTHSSEKVVSREDVLMDSSPAPEPVSGHQEVVLVAEDQSYTASYTVGSSPDVDPDTSGEVVSSNAPSPFGFPAEEQAVEAAEVLSTSFDSSGSATNLYDEYYSSVPVSPTGSYSLLAHAFDDHLPATSTPSSRVPTPSSSRAPVFTLPGSPSPSLQSSFVRNFSAPFRSETSFSSPRLSPSAASVTSRPLSQLGSATLSLESSTSLSVVSPTPADPPPSATTTKVPFGFRHSARVRSQEPSISSIRTFGSTSLAMSRHRPPALTGLSDPADNQSRSSSVASLRTRESHLLSPELQLRSASPRRLKPLRLSLILNSSSTLASLSSAVPPSLTTATTASTHTPASPTVSSDYSISHNHLLMSPHSAIPDHDTHLDSQPHSAPATDTYQSSIPFSDSATRRQSWQHRLSRDNDSKHPSSRRSSLAQIPPYTRPSSRMSEQLESLHEEEEVDLTARYEVTADEADNTIHEVPQHTLSPPASVFQARPPSVLRSPIHAIATPRPTLLFAIASDDVDEVRRVLESGEARPNDNVGPQPALAFAVTANQLKHKQEIIKLLLAHGANPTVLSDLQNAVASRSVSPSDSQPGGETPAAPGLLDSLDPATRYFISRAEAPQTRRASALIHRSFFRPLTKVRYDLIGQDRALEQLFRVLSMPSAAPIVVLLCGPSGHGKSLLARKFGSLLDVPTHTVNMTTLTSTHDIWRSYSMSPFEEPSNSTLGDFLTENQGKRCVVVLDEIEKVEDQKYLASLLMPWELGRCSFGAGQRHVNVSKVIWLGTSNIGHDLVFEHQTQRSDPAAAVTREEYVDLMGLLRPQVSDRLGPSLLSRVTTVLPFVPFSDEEKMAIAAEALHSLTAAEGPTLPAVTVEKLVRDSLQGYAPVEGARSLYRAVSNLLLDTIY